MISQCHEVQEIVHRLSLHRRVVTECLHIMIRDHKMEQRTMQRAQKSLDGFAESCRALDFIFHPFVLERDMPKERQQDIENIYNRFYRDAPSQEKKMTRSFLAYFGVLRDFGLKSENERQNFRDVLKYPQNHLDRMIYFGVLSEFRILNIIPTISEEDRETYHQYELTVNTYISNLPNSTESQEVIEYAADLCNLRIAGLYNVLPLHIVTWLEERLVSFFEPFDYTGSAIVAGALKLNGKEPELSTKHWELLRASLIENSKDPYRGTEHAALLTILAARKIKVPDGGGLIINGRRTGLPDENLS